MDVVLVSAFGRRADAHWSQAIAATVAADQARKGARVRWLCPLAREQAPPAEVAGVALTVLRRRPAAFRSVLAHSSHMALDVALANVLRPLGAAVVVHVGFGAPGSVATLWLAERMGASALAVVRASEVLCYRGTLVDSTGSACDRFLDPERCAQCACQPWLRGLSPLQARAARWLRPLGAWSPFPTPAAIRSRSDIALAGLQLASIVVATPGERDQLVSAGLPERNVRVAGGGAALPDAAAVMAAVEALA